MVEPVSRFFTSQGLRLNVWDWGNESAPPLLLVHGGLDHGRSWDYFAQRLRDDYHVMAFDLRGHGDSDWAHGSSYPLPDFVADVANFLFQEKIERTKIIAHSMGGAISLLLAGTFPQMVTRMVVIEGLRPAAMKISSPHEQMKLWIEKIRHNNMRAPRGYTTFEDALARMREAHPRLTDEQARHLTKHGVKQLVDGTWFWKSDINMMLRTPYRLSFEDHASIWKHIECPVMLVRGTASGRPDPAGNNWISHFRNAVIHDVEGADHWVQHDEPDALLATSREFLRG